MTTLPLSKNHFSDHTQIHSHFYYCQFYVHGRWTVLSGSLVTNGRKCLKQLWTTNKGWYSILGFGQGANNSFNSWACYEILQRGLTWMDSFDQHKQWKNEHEIWKLEENVKSLHRANSLKTVAIMRLATLQSMSHSVVDGRCSHLYL